MVGGMLIQVALADGLLGGPPPLPDPMEFNHNALFHALYAAGLLALAVGVLCDTADAGRRRRNRRTRPRAGASSARVPPKFDIPTPSACAGRFKIWWGVTP